MRYQSGWRLEYVEIIVGADRQKVTMLLELLDDFIDADNSVRCNGSIYERVGLGFIGLRWESANPAAVLRIRYINAVFRPPSEAQSLILPVTNGCSWNKCTECEMYTAPQKKFRVSCNSCGEFPPRGRSIQGKLPRMRAT